MNKGSFIRGNTAARKAASPLKAHLNMRITHEEKAQWAQQAKSNGLRLAEWVRKKLNT